MDSRIVKNPVHVIDPVNMSREDNELLYQFLQENLNKEVLFTRDRPDDPYCVNNKEFKLEYDLLWYRSNSNYCGYHYIIFLISQPIANGSFGNLLLGLGSLTPRADGILEFSATHYVIKQQNHNSKKPGKIITSLDLQREVDITAFAGYSIKQPTVAYFNKKGWFANPSNSSKFMTYSFIVMEYVKGKELYQIIYDDAGRRKLNTDLRLEISVKVLRALKMLHKKDILHCDIKPENILVFINKHVCFARIIDFGLSRKKQSGYLFCGSMNYVPPEAFHNRFDEAGDGYTAAKTLALLWRAEQALLENKWEYDEFASKATFKNLFEDIDDLDLDHALRISILLNAMIAFNVKERPSIDKAIDILEDIQLQRELKKAKQFHQEIMCADNIALALREYLEKISIENTSNKNPYHLINALREKICEAIKKIPDNSFALKRFVSRLGVEAFEGLQTKQAINDLVCITLNELPVNANLFLQLPTPSDLRDKHTFSNSPYILHLLRDYEGVINQIANQHEKLVLSFDNLIKLNDKIKRKIEKAKRFLSDIIHYKPSATATSPLVSPANLSIFAHLHFNNVSTVKDKVTRLQY